MKGNGYSADTPSAQEYPFLCFRELGTNLDSCHPPDRKCQETPSLACRRCESTRQPTIILTFRMENNQKLCLLIFSAMREGLVSRLLVFSERREGIAIVSSYFPNGVRLMQPFTTNLPPGRQLTTPRPELARHQPIPLYIYVRFHWKPIIFTI